MSKISRKQKSALNVNVSIAQGINKQIKKDFANKNLYIREAVYCLRRLLAHMKSLVVGHHSIRAAYSAMETNLTGYEIFQLVKMLTKLAREDKVAFDNMRDICEMLGDFCFVAKNDIEEKGYKELMKSLNVFKKKLCNENMKLSKQISGHLKVGISGVIE